GRASQQNLLPFALCSHVIRPLRAQREEQRLAKGLGVGVARSPASPHLLPLSEDLVIAESARRQGPPLENQHVMQVFHFDFSLFEDLLRAASKHMAAEEFVNRGPALRI